MAEAITLDADAFNKRFDRLYEAWNTGYTDSDSPWHDVDAVALIAGKADDSASEAKTTAFHLWSLGYEFPETLLVLLKTQKLFAVASQKKVALLETVRLGWEGHSGGGSFDLFARNKEDDQANMDKICSAIKGLRDNASVAICAKESHVGPFADAWQSCLQGHGFPLLQTAGQALSQTMAAKDDREVNFMKKASQLAVAVLKTVLINKIEDVIDREQKVSHEALCKECERAIEDEKLLKKWQEKYQLSPTFIDLLYSQVQSGTRFDLKPSLEPSKENLSLNAGCILVGVGAKYKDYHANITRTLVLNGTQEQKDLYAFLLEVFDKAVKTLVPGNKFSDVYDACRKMVDDRHAKDPSLGLQEGFVKAVGHLMGIEFKDSTFTLNNKCDKVIEPRMVFNLSIGFSGIKGKGGKPCALWIADTVMVPASTGEAPLVLTESHSKTLTNVSYELEDQEDEPAPKKPADKKAPSANGSTRPSPAPPAAQANGAAAAKVAASVLKNADSVVIDRRLRDRRNIGATEEDARKIETQQKELRKKKQDEIKSKILGGKGRKGGDDKKHVRKLDTLSCYTDPSSFPKDLKPSRIYVDENRDCVFVPIHGVHVPFHASTIKNVSCQAEDNNKHSLRINFQVPGSMTGRLEDNPLPDLSESQRSMFIKELIFRAADGRNLNNVFKKIKDLQKKVKQKENLEDEKRDLVQQQALQINKNKTKVVLKDLMIRPTIERSKRLVGNLEAHTNGLRFSASRSADSVDIIYSNIKHAIFQPVFNELIVLVHFHLKNPIMIGKKKTQDIQFYTEAGNQTDDLDQRRGGRGYDPDEIAEEQRERDLKAKLNADFKRFVEQVEQMAGIEFDVPYRELHFPGVPARSNVEILPTPNCLVHLVEWPPFVLTIEEIELVSFERVSHGLRNFDMVFIFQDWSKPVRRIDSVPVEFLDMIKKWLNEIEMVWYEGKQNLNWVNIFKSINGDLEGFVREGGFAQFLGDDTEEADAEDSEEEDDEYAEEDDDGSDFSEDEEDSDDESLADEGDSDEDFNSLDSDESEGKDWDELESEAEKDDRKRKGDGYSDSEEERPKKKKARK